MKSLPNATKSSYYRNRKAMLWYDYVAIIVAIATIFVIFFVLRGDTGQYAEVYKQGNLIARYELSTPGEYTIVADYPLTLVIKDGEASIIDAHCPALVCVHSPSIKNTGEVIICAANRIVIKISGTPPEDAVTY